MHITCIHLFNKKRLVHVMRSGRNYIRHLVMHNWEILVVLTDEFRDMSILK